MDELACNPRFRLFFVNLSRGAQEVVFRGRAYAGQCRGMWRRHWVDRAAFIGTAGRWLWKRDALRYREQTQWESSLARSRDSLSIWPTPDIRIEPETPLSSWRVLETEKYARHLVGYSLALAEGRVSSAIESFDLRARQVRTMSGRVYRLEGPPGFCADGDYVWQHWKRINEVQQDTDISTLVWKEIESAGRKRSLRI